MKKEFVQKAVLVLLIVLVSSFPSELCTQQNSSNADQYYNSGSEQSGEFSWDDLEGEQFLDLVASEQRDMDHTHHSAFYEWFSSVIGTAHIGGRLIKHFCFKVVPEKTVFYIKVALIYAGYSQRNLHDYPQPKSS